MGNYQLPVIRKNALQYSTVATRARLIREGEIDMFRKLGEMMDSERMNNEDEVFLI
jgi:hypothetical protein